MSTAFDLQAQARAIELANLSPCGIQHGVVITKHEKILGEGFNYTIGEAGVHAEIDAIHDALKRCGGDKKKLWGARLISVGIRKKTGKFVQTARPCEHLGPRKNAAGAPCMKKIREAGINKIEYTTSSGEWCEEDI